MFVPRVNPPFSASEGQDALPVSSLSDMPSALEQPIRAATFHEADGGCAQPLQQDLVIGKARSRWRWALLLIPIALISFGTWLHFHRLHVAEASLPAERTPWALQVGTVKRGRVADTIEVLAVIEAPHSIVLSPQIQGVALVVGPRAGVAVKRGDLLVQIDAQSIANNIGALEHQRAGAMAEFEFATKQHVRVDALRANGTASQSQADQTLTTADAARAKAKSLAEQIAALRVQLDYAEIRAPQDAVVAERIVEVGDTAVPGKPVYRLTAGNGTVVRVSVPAAKLSEVQVGSPLVLRHGDATLRLPVARVAPTVNAAGLGTVEADAPAAPFGLPSGSMVAATLVTTESGEALTVPAAALVGAGAGAHVMVLRSRDTPNEHSLLDRVDVRVLQEGAVRTAVQGNLRPGDQVAVGQTAVLARLHDGDAAVTATSMGAGR
jgi:RND family efflux transporter MFP subunit